MTDVRIARLSATVAGWPDPDQVPTMLQHLSADRLEQALRQSPLPDGEWCVRRLDVAVELDPERPRSALESDWADQIVTALRLSLRDGSQGVVRYLRPEEAVDDVLLSLSTGRFENAWAWSQVGLLEPGDPDPQADPRSSFLRVLARLPRGRAAALARLVAATGPAPVYRLLGSAGWVQVATLVAAEAGTSWTPMIRTTMADGATSEPLPSTTAAEQATNAPTDGGVDALAEAISSGTLARSLRSSGLRADWQTRQAWAVLVMGAADPALLRAAPRRLRALVTAVGELLRPQTEPGLAAARRQGSAIGSHGSTATARPVSPPDSEDAPGTGTHPTAPAGTVGTRPRPVKAASLEPHESTDPLPRSHTSSWGGLLFLLNSAPDAGLPDLLDQPPFDNLPAPWVLHRLGQTLIPIEPDDPALLAFSSLTPGRLHGPGSEAERSAITALARRWSAATAKRLRPAGTDGSGPTDAELVLQLARRQVTIEREPGWVEVSLRLDEVDLDVRRAGLDINPGWVWWLAHVVRFRYE